MVKQLLTGGVVEGHSLGTAASIVVGKHVHQVGVATHTGEVAAGAVGGAVHFSSVISLDEGLVLVSMG